MGVADGVGGGRDLGLSSRDFSAQLMANCRDLAGQEEDIHPKEMMVRAVAGTKRLGSSTVLLGCIRGSSWLAANLGDSGFIFLLAWQVVEASRPMQASFSAPLQVGYDTESEEPQFDDPCLAETYDIPIIKVLRKCFESSGDNVEDAAAMLVEKARLKMQNVTPYFDACREHGMRVDDLTVLVAEITDPARSAVRGIVELAPAYPSLKLEALVICQYTDIKVGTFCGQFSKELSRKCAKLASKFTSPKDIIQAAAASRSKCKVRVTSTIILASLVFAKDYEHAKQQLYIANMGDSRVMTTHSGSVMLQYQEQGTLGTTQDLLLNLCISGFWAVVIIAVKVLSQQLENTSAVLI
ncbi:hypothetical protein GOP47_0005345 [Adiantum capillus-veneris]|uniref:Protein phosphatase n=1 Tax=Adiantum capillus-veneris TaxID=13818 RepID=A0A9D4V5U6_ADICA|nr:hypothetical protein GOP47_0005345 [Adiantum capillus-veneris]